MVKQIIYIPLISLLIMALGCTDYNKAQKQAEKEAKIKGAVVQMLSDADGKRLNLTPRDTILELDNETELVLWEKSFLNQDSSVYVGEVKLSYYFTSNPKNILFQQYDERHTALEEIMGVIQFRATDEKGNKLVLNPEYPTVLRFHPKLKMLATTYFQYDSIKHKYSTPIYFYEKVITESIRQTNNKELISDIETDDEFIGSNNHTKNQKYKGRSLTKSKIIGYEMTLKNFGFYYISRENKKQNLQVVNISIQAQSRKPINWEKVKTLLFTNQNDYNYYLRAENSGNGLFKIIPAAGHNEVKLPLQNNYTLLMYGIDGEKCYFFKDKVKLTYTNLIEVRIKEIEFEQLLKEIKQF